MYIHELLNNPEFNFNAPVRILKYLGGDETVTVFDSTVSGDIHFDLMMKSITAINPGDDGVLEIEYATHSLDFRRRQSDGWTAHRAFKSRRRLSNEDHRSYHRR